ncbi:MAG: D-glycero-beta-D-manno-heptose-7-phosphate kinase [Flavobacteriales bacterium]|jgi:rfaE bifunctional protein kinase chain/domain|nr:D-glycero-beta-D-manno-heptose-7-phosphate kinase [Flavobacteriales bacterium]MBK6892794.1 D-glycero-beta-D-manno-heptose-7-phosphate kinase [Flavobacteriales bacterium]MBK7246938.1 D-glycero-beta-D-manno-heptose-7-phosphate kinase [Flavobacteriales bacterium]MBK9599125.1 D-glycero-beta-D-manno-heptose-7-phosphate kinase [Flavobacteriales bacterium]QQS72601.1 MAG: D-glycero-beta-D-manno-heptose-7-phosphate kinase [Flavobacteriales bacterium]
MTPKEITNGFKSITALVVGDVMLDAYLWGRVDRISPEAPVPVVQVGRRSARLGGAANVALNIRALGAKAIVASVIGEDAHAEDLARIFAEEGLSSDGILRSSDRRTTVKTRIISGDQHVVRVDEETLSDLSAEEERRFLHHVFELMRKEKPGVLILEDYDKGVLSPGVIAGLITEAHRIGIPVAVDPKRRHFFDYREVDLFKPNLKELRDGLKVDIPAGDKAAVGAAVRMLEARLANKASLITLSEHGVFAHGPGEEILLPAHKRNIIDVSGAGDTVIAVAGLCLAMGMPLAEIAAWANLAGGLVCEHVGVVPVDLARLTAEAERIGPGTPARKP